MAGGLSVAAAALAALQTFLNHKDRASAHRLAGARYGALVRQIEALLAVQEEIPASGVLDVLRSKMDRLAEDAPELPERVWKRSLRELPSTESEVAYTVGSIAADTSTETA